ncbi:MAG: DUF5110 domain-containing protein, partial [Beijerinckiaceae bacterium]
VFIRGGAAVVLASTTPDVKPHDAPARRLYLAVGSKEGVGPGQHFEDDGVSWSFQKGQCLNLDISWRWNSKTAEVQLTGETGSLALPPVSAWSVETAGIKLLNTAIENKG